MRVLFLSLLCSLAFGFLPTFKGTTQFLNKLDGSLRSISILQDKILSQPDVRLEKEDGTFTSTHRLAKEWLKARPEVLTSKGNYTLLQNGLAAKAFKKALEKKDPRLLPEIVARYPYTQAAANAEHLLGIIAMETNELSKALDIFREITDDAETLAKLDAPEGALARLILLTNQDGLNAERDAAIQKLKARHGNLRIAGNKTPVDRWVATLPARKDVSFGDEALVAALKSMQEKGTLEKQEARFRQGEKEGPRLLQCISYEKRLEKEDTIYDFHFLKRGLVGITKKHRMFLVRPLAAEQVSISRNLPENSLFAMGYSLRGISDYGAVASRGSKVMALSRDFRSLMEFEVNPGMRTIAGKTLTFPEKGISLKYISAMSPSGRYTLVNVSADRDKSIYLLDSETQKWIPVGVQGWEFQKALFDEAKGVLHLVANDPARIYTVSLKTGAKEKEIETGVWHTQLATAVLMKGGETIAVLDKEGTPLYIDLTTKQTHKYPEPSLTLIPESLRNRLLPIPRHLTKDGKRILTVGNGHLTVNYLTMPLEVPVQIPIDASWYGFAESADGDLVAVYDDKNVCLVSLGMEELEGWKLPFELPKPIRTHAVPKE